MDKSKKALFYMLVLMMTICDFVIFLTSMSVVFPRGSGWLTVICALEFILLVDIIPIFLLMPEIIALRRLSIE
ncbi:MAG: hypothetical protein LBT59_22995, partial [Clostridiales bacterium]|nr:hypothetical protein [Clostridiales bacterium]